MDGVLLLLIKTLPDDPACVSVWPVTLAPLSDIVTAPFTCPPVGITMSSVGSFGTCPRLQFAGSLKLAPTLMFTPGANELTAAPVLGLQSAVITAAEESA